MKYRATFTGRKLAGLVEQLTPDQLAMFSACFGTTEADEVKPADLATAMRICANTVRTNREEGTNP